MEALTNDLVSSTTSSLDQRRIRLPEILRNLSSLLAGGGDAAMARPLLAVLPKVLECLFGAKGSTSSPSSSSSSFTGGAVEQQQQQQHQQAFQQRRGLVHLDSLSASEQRALREFLLPPTSSSPSFARTSGTPSTPTNSSNTNNCSPLLLKLLSLQPDHDAVYVMQVDHLPPQIQKLLKGGGELTSFSMMNRRNLSSYGGGGVSGGGMYPSTPSSTTPNKASGGGMVMGGMGGTSASDYYGSMQQQQQIQMQMIQQQGGGGGSSNSMAPPQQLQQRIMFNMFEYYMFCFALSVTLLPDMKPYRNGSGENTNPSQQPMRLESFYTNDLVLGYLKFFLPPTPPPTPRLQSTTAATPLSALLHTTPSRPSYANRVIVSSAHKQGVNQQQQQHPTDLDNTNIFKCTAQESIPSALASAHFALEALMELWLASGSDWEGAGTDAVASSINDGFLNGNTQSQQQQQQQQKPYVKPNAYQVTCISNFISHLVSLDLSVISIETLSRLHCDRGVGGMIEGVYDINKANVYKSFGVKLYRYLCIAMKNWPNDETILVIVSQWLTYAFPWKTKGTGYFTDEWATFVGDHFLMYTQILQLFIQRALKFDYSGPRLAQRKESSSSSARSYVASSRGSPSKDSRNGNSGYMYILESVLAYFQDDKLLEMLRALEGALCTLKSFGSTTAQSSGGLAAASSTLRSSSSTTKLTSATSPSPLSRASKGDLAYLYRNSGTRTRQHVINFESPRFLYSPVFDYDINNVLVSQLVSVLSNANVRLHHRKNIALKHLAAKKEEANTFGSSFANFFGITDSSFDPFHEENIESLDASIGRLTKAGEILISIWNVVNFNDEAINVLKRTSSDLLGLGSNEGEMDQGEELAEPQRSFEVGNVLTLRGVEQVKKGLRKSTSENIPLLQSNRVKTLVRSNEMAFLVHLVDWIATTFDNLFPILYENLNQTKFGGKFLTLCEKGLIHLPKSFRDSYLPTHPGLHWLRFLASYDSLLLLALLWILFRVLPWIGYILSGLYIISFVINIKKKVVT